MIERTVLSVASYVESFDIKESPLLPTVFVLFVLLMGSLVVCSTFVAFLLPANINGALSLGFIANAFVWWFAIGALIRHQGSNR